MSFRVPRYSDMTTNVTQAVPRGGSQEITRFANMIGRIRPGFIVVGTFFSNQNSLSAGVYVFRVDGEDLFTYSVPSNFEPGSYNLARSIPNEVRIIPNTVLSIQAPAQNMYGPEATIEFQWRISPLIYTTVPEQSGKIWAPNGSIYSPARSLWISETVSFNQYEWRKVWEIPPPPPPPPGNLSIVQNQFEGGAVTASWTNTPGSGGIGWELQWQERHGSSWFTIWTQGGTSNNAAQSSEIPEIQLADGNDYRARIRYVSGGETGDWSSVSNTLTYIGLQPI